MDTQIESINDPHALLAEVRKVREHVASEGERILARWRPKLQRDDFDAGSTNLAHYLALRELDLRSLQRVLISWGVSGLGRSESRVLPTLDAVLANLALICGDQDAVQLRPSIDDFYQGSSELKAQTNKLFGTASDGRETRILVTMQPKKCKDLDYVRIMFDAGMNMARINCAHDSAGVWLAAIENIRKVAAERGVRCPILMDLQGPKIRTRSVITPAKSNKVKGGDRIFLTFDEPQPSSEFNFQTSCATPDVLRQVGPGAVVSIKDGLIRGQVDEVREEGLVVAVTRTPPDGQPLENEKGINFPSTALTVSPLTEQDLKDLDFVAEHADIVAYSFVQRREDIAWLQRELLARRPDCAPMAIVAKIETQLSFTNLPELIVQAAGANPFGVMIARGDLAVEIGYERLSEVQEEILWVCEAAHVPVIWATQVLEGLVKRGMPSRGEFTDAAMGNRAECVMLNKGRYIDEGIAVLDNVLCRMERHQVKKSPQLRALSAWAGMH
jgi:pyruvate kinase